MKLRHAAGFKPPCGIRQDARHSNARISVQWFSMAPRSIEKEARDLSTAPRLSIDLAMKIRTKILEKPHSGEEGAARSESREAAMPRCRKCFTKRYGSALLR
jgi:hypothetical protein